MSADLLEAVRNTMSAHQLLPRRARVVVAVSGGPDSVALLHLLMRLAPEWPLVLHAAHLDHALRPASAQDAAFVRSVTAQWGIPATIERIDVGACCAREGWSLEDGARRIRYQFLLEAARRHSASHIAVAHTADDQAETVLMRLIRGTGLLGLCAIPVQRELEELSEESCRSPVTVVRPLLEAWRSDILAYLGRMRLAFREDATNADLTFLRNRIRHELLPLLEQRYNPNIRRALVQLAEQSRDDYAFLQAAARRQWKRTAKSPARRRANGARAPASPRLSVALSVDGFLRQPKALQRQLVRQAVQAVRGQTVQLEFRHWLEAEHAFTRCPAGTVVDLPGGIQLRREKDRVICQLAASASRSV